MSKMRQVKDLLNYLLEDDETATGGVAFAGETLKDFLEEADLNEDATLEEVNKALVECGIKPIPDKYVFTQTGDDGVDTTFYFEDNALDGAIIAGNREYTDFFYIDSELESKLKEECYLSNTKDVVAFLTKETGKEYTYKTLRGYCQSDWQYMYYSKDKFTKERLQEIEDFYFGNVVEYADEEDTTTIVPDSVNTKEYLAQITGCKPEDIILRKIKGYVKTPIYEEE